MEVVAQTVAAEGSQQEAEANWQAGNPSVVDAFLGIPLACPVLPEVLHTHHYQEAVSRVVQL